MKHNDLIKEKYKKTCKHLNNFDHLLVLVSTVTICVPIFAFTSLAAIPIGITSSTVGLKICTIAARIKNYKSSIKKKRKKHDKILLLGKTKLNTIEVLISTALIDSYIHNV